MKNLLKRRQNKWSEISKGFSAKLRKNTVFLIGFNTYKIRKNTQEFSRSEFRNILKNKQNTKYENIRNG